MNTAQTEAQWLARVRAARAMLNQTLVGDKPASEMAAFMALFHPYHPKTQELIIEAKIE